MNGATLKLNDGLRYGAFLPDGAPRAGAAPFFGWEAAADLGHAILAEDVGYFEVEGGTLDLNSSRAILGGEWGDTGRQLPHYGVSATNCRKVVWTDVHVRNSCLDGFLYTLPGARTVTTPLIMRGCSAVRVARNCVSITGCDGILVDRCRFERAGEAPTGTAGATFGSKPRSCFDVEAEGPLCRDVVIRNSFLIGGAGTATSFVADSGDTADILIENSTLVGMVWTTKPRTVIRGCRIDGGFGRLLGGADDPSDNTVIEDCSVSDRWPGGGPPPNNIISGEGAAARPGSPILVRNTNFDIHFHAANLRWASVENVEFVVHAGTATLEPGHYIMFLAGAQVRNMRIVDRIPRAVAPSVPYYVHEADLADIFEAMIESPAGRILWNANSVAAGGYAGRYRGRPT